MAIDFHPEAARRFDEQGAGLLTQVTDCGVAESGPRTFRPDVHPVAHLGEGDIIGEIRVKRSVVNMAQEEVGRVFESAGKKLGLVDEGYKALTRLAAQIQKTGELRETTTREFIQDVVFDWVSKKAGGDSQGPLTDFVRQAADSEIKDYEIWIPVHQFYLERNISIGGVQFQTVTQRMMDDWDAKRKVAPSEEEAFVKVAVDRARSKVQGCAAGSVVARGIRDKALEIARFRAERAVAFLRFFSPVNWSPNLRSYCVPLGGEAIVQMAALFVENGRIINYLRGVLDQTQKGWVLTNALREQFPGLLDRLIQLLDAEKATPYQEALRDAMLLYSRNSLTSEPADKLVYILAGLESILIRNDTEPITKSLAERMAFLIGKDVENRKAVIANVSDTYRLRSSFVHHGNSVEDLDTLRTFMVNAWSCLHNLVFYQDRLKTKDDLIEALENRKLA